MIQILIQLTILKCTSLITFAVGSIGLLHMKLYITFIASLLCFSSYFLQGQSLNPSSYNKQQQWVDSIYNSLSLERKIAQLYMAIAHTESNMPYVEYLVDSLGIGGFCFMQGNPIEQVSIINKLQKRVPVPLWFSMDAEWGVGMRLPLVQPLPKALMLGAVQDSMLAYQVGQTIGAQMQRMGLHINYAPVVDINSNPENVVINYRSFGENKKRVAKAAASVMRGMQAQGIIACAKHFPGHGNTSTDSHVSLPVIHQSKKEMEETEMYPYKQLIQQGLKGIMSAHLHVPSLDNTPNMPASFSPKIIHDVLRKQLGFQGLVFTDGLNMQSVVKMHSSATLDYLSFMAGNDVLLFSKLTSAGIDTLRRAYLNGIITEERLAHSVKKILSAKYQAGLWKPVTIDTMHLVEDLNNQIHELFDQVALSAITCVQDKNEIIQAICKGNLSEVSLVSLTPQSSLFKSTLSQLGLKDIIQLNGANSTQTKKDIELIRTKKKVIVCVDGLTQSPLKKFGLDSARINIIQTLAQLQNTIMVFFGNPYALRFCCDAPSVLVAYDESEAAQRAAIKVFTGEHQPTGKLPVSVCESFKEGMSYFSSGWRH